MTLQPRTATASFKPMKVTAGPGQISFQIGGSGPVLVLFHSLLADHTSFDLITPTLKKTHRVVVLDLPGFGDSTAVEGGLDAVADRVAAALTELQFESAATFIGNGYGGFVALLTAIRHPHLADKLVLADCGACFSETGRAAFRGMSAGAAKGGLISIADVAMRRLFAPNFQAEHIELIADRKARFIAVDPSTFHAACEGLATLDLRPQLASVKVPVLVIVGELDEATPPAMSRELAAGLPDAIFVELQGCAHVPQLQEPELFLATVAPFLGIIMGA